MRRANHFRAPRPSPVSILLAAAHDCSSNVAHPPDVKRTLAGLPGTRIALSRRIHRLYYTFPTAAHDLSASESQPPGDKRVATVSMLRSSGFPTSNLFDASFYLLFMCPRTLNVSTERLDCFAREAHNYQFHFQLRHIVASSGVKLTSLRRWPSV